ncbi:uncharacterized protein VTP21DRAFT_10233 [Calcarisporiella thermophila]|uniref:uncharacterized protein n=1 Tax=Calcarisporiella thermophila TaxID=911321 RepID=UPI0037435B48
MTTNGKADKAKLKEIPIQQARGRQLPATEKQKLVTSLMASVLNIDTDLIDLHTSFFTLGGDSISAIALVSAFRRHGYQLTVAQIFKSPTPARLATIMQERHDKPSQRSEAVVGDIPLTPIQHWFFESKRRYLNFFNQGWVLNPREHIDFEQFKQAIAQIVAHHDMLRARYTRDSDGMWRQTVLGAELYNMNVQHIVCRDEDEFLKLAKHKSASLDIECGPLHSATLFEIKGEQRIHFTIHHLVIDLVSWRIILEDLEILLKGGRLEEKTTSFQEWAIAQEQHAQYFDPSVWDQHINIADMSILANPDPTGVSASSLLDKANETYRTNTQDLALTALLLSFQEVIGKEELSLFLEGHGREPWNNQLDISRTVGWFTTVFPVTLSTLCADSIDTIIKRLKNTLRSIPDKGLSYGAIKHLSPSTDATNAATRALRMKYSTILLLIVISIPKDVFS